MNTSEVILEFDQIKEMLCSYAMSDSAKVQLSALSPFLKERECHQKMAETTEARQILDSVGTPPLSAMKEIDSVLALCAMGSMLTAGQLEYVSTFISSCKRIKGYLQKAESLQVEIAYYGRSVSDLSQLHQEINQSIGNEAVLSSASPKMRSIRLSIERESEQIRKKLNDMLQNKKSFFTDANVTLRNGRYVVPVKKEFKNQFGGTVIDVSSTGGTYFIEPKSISDLQDKINVLKMEEENEIRRILYTLTALVDASIPEIKVNMEAMITLDVVFAKARMSADMKAVPAVVDTGRCIHICQGRHPLLKQSECVPLDFSIGGEVRGIVITGPNTGGKTVALKTVGLLSMMAQCGLHVPVKEGRFCMNNLILCDIGDGQSITENLSTFSSHITNIIGILGSATQESLVLLDELGSGTDPAEGMGIAISILEELRAKKCLFLATTHYPEVKEYAAKAPGLVNARMAFDRESLKPLYRLEIGEAGESCALYIAKRLGFPSHMLKRASQEAYHKKEREVTDKGNEWIDNEQEENASRKQASCTAPRIEKDEPKKPKSQQNILFQRGDSVMVYPQKNLGIIYQTADEKGQVGVQIQGKKHLVNHKRLQLKVAASRLYPPDYDFSIVFDTVENRKIRHQMERKYIKGLAIELEQGEE